MPDRDHRYWRWLAIGLAAFLALSCALVLVGGLRHNATTSAAKGFYARAPWRDLDRGQLVYACTPVHAWPIASRYGLPVPALGAFCEARQLSVLKRIAAIPGDHVVLTVDGVTVNGHALPASAPLVRDSAAQPLPFQPRDQVLGPGEYWITSALPIPTGLDSRYFGPLRRADITAPAILLWRTSE